MRDRRTKRSAAQQKQKVNESPCPHVTWELHQDSSPRQKAGGTMSDRGSLSFYRSYERCLANYINLNKLKIALNEQINVKKQCPQLKERKPLSPCVAVMHPLFPSLTMDLAVLHIKLYNKDIYNHIQCSTALSWWTMQSWELELFAELKTAENNGGLGAYQGLR